MVPWLDEYLKPVYEQADPEAGIEEGVQGEERQGEILQPPCLISAHRRSSLACFHQAFCWKAFRLIMKNVGLLSKVSAQGGSLESAVKHLFENKDAGKEEGVVDDKLGE